MKIRKLLEENVNELVDVGAPHLWGHIKMEFQRLVIRCVRKLEKQRRYMVVE